MLSFFLKSLQDFDSKVSKPDPDPYFRMFKYGSGSGSGSAPGTAGAWPSSLLVSSWREWGWRRRWGRIRWGPGPTDRPPHHRYSSHLGPAHNPTEHHFTNPPVITDKIRVKMEKLDFCMFAKIIFDKCWLSLKFVTKRQNLPATCENIYFHKSFCEKICKQ
jgi:hypothetical protein